MTEERSLHLLAPIGIPDRMLGAWVSLVAWAVSDDDTLAAFRADTGSTWTPAADGLGRMIDNATGADWEFVRSFAGWVNENLWGDEDDDGEQP